jgi:3-phenylpropionate/trans-cinnamate dioxygenase ferredoxin component
MAEFFKAATTGEIPAGGVKCCELNGLRIAIFNLDGRYFAISDTCSHEDASLSEGFVEGSEVECPLHGARFDIRTGRVLTPPAIEDVQSFEVRVLGEDVLVSVSTKD